MASSTTGSDDHEQDRSRDIGGWAKRVIERARSVARRPSPSAPIGRDVFRRRLAWLIVAVSMAGAFASWRAADASEEAGGLRHQASQDQIFQEQYRLNAASLVAEDLRLLAGFEEHFEANQVLFSESRRSAGTKLGEVLGRAAARELAQWELLAPYFTIPPTLQGSRWNYTAEANRRNLTRFDPRFVVLDPEGVRQRADENQDEAVGYTRAAILFAAALFFLTVAGLMRARRRRWWALVGILITLAAVLQVVI